MSDSSQGSGKKAPDFDDQLLTLWARVSLDFGHSGFEGDSESVAEDGSEKKMRAEIERIIGSLHGVTETSANSDIAQTDPSTAQLEGLDLSPQVLEELLEEEIISLENIPAAERDTADVQEAGLETGQISESAENLPEAEFERQVRETNAEDVVQALVLASIDLPEVIVYEADEDHVDVFVLCLRDGDRLLTVHVADTGKLEVGIDFYEDFVSDFLDLLPVRGALCAGEDSYRLSAPVTIMGETVQIDADARVAALVELDMSQLSVFLRGVQLPGAVEAAPADHGWILVSADPVSLLMLLESLGASAILAESTGNNHHLSFILPGGSSATAHEIGSWKEWMSKVVGDPAPYDRANGAVIDLIWGAPKISIRSFAQDSPVTEALWELPGNLPESLNSVRMVDEVENLMWIYGLDSSEARRLRNYVENSDSDLGMESVLQLLEVSDALAKVVLGSLQMEKLEGYRLFGPADADYKIGSVFSTLWGRKVPQAFRRSSRLYNRGLTSNSAGTFIASGALAALAAQRRLHGKSARLEALGSAALFGAGLAEIAAYRLYSDRQKALEGSSPKSADTPSLMDELQYAVKEDRGGIVARSAPGLSAGRGRVESYSRERVRKLRPWAAYSLKKMVQKFRY